MTRLNQLADLGQAIWIDFIRRSFMLSGEMQTLVDQGLRGMTSNPTIFDKAISGSNDYDDDLAKLAQAGSGVWGRAAAMTWFGRRRESLPCGPSITS